MRKLIALCVWAVGCIFAAAAHAVDDWQSLSSVAIEARRQGVTIESPWLQHMRVDVEPNEIRYADGGSMMRTPDIAYSYDNKPRDVSRFFKPKYPRINAIMRYAGRAPGEIISIGVDSGYSAEKIRVEPALFLGYTRAFEFAPNTHLAVGASRWFGGEVREFAVDCEIDIFCRKYHAATLLSWRDYQPNPSRDYMDREVQYDMHYHLMLIHEF